MLNIRIIASQIGNLTDARYFAAMGVEWMGFSLDPGGVSYLSPAEVSGIKAWVEGPKIIGSFNIQPIQEILSIAEDIGLNGVQVGPFLPANQLAQLEDYEVLQEIIIEPVSTAKAIMELVEARQQQVDYFLLDFEKNGFSWQDLKTGNSPIGIKEVLFIQQLKPVILALIIAPGELEELSKTFPGIGLSLKGGAEEKVGFKSYDEMDEIFDAITE